MDSDLFSHSMTYSSRGLVIEISCVCVIGLKMYTRFKKLFEILPESFMTGLGRFVASYLRCNGDRKEKECGLNSIEYCQNNSKIMSCFPFQPIQCLRFNTYLFTIFTYLFIYSISDSIIISIIAWCIFPSCVGKVDRRACS